MNKLSILLVGCLFAATGCHKKKTTQVVSIPADTINPIDSPDRSWRDIAAIPDTVYSIKAEIVDSLKNVIRYKDSALFEARFKLARVWYYDSLCLKNSRLDKYLKGWIRRALEK